MSHAKAQNRKQAVHERKSRGSRAGDSFAAEVEACWAGLALALADAARGSRPEEIQSAARRTVQLLLFLGLCEGRGLTRAGSVAKAAAGRGPAPRLAQWLSSKSSPMGPELLEVRAADGDALVIDEVVMLRRLGDALSPSVVARLVDAGRLAHARGTGADLLGAVHQRLTGRQLARDGHGRFRILATGDVRRKAGLFYTPQPIARYMARGALSAEGRRRAPVRILDPACGCGSFLLAACRELLQSRRPAPGARGLAVAGQLHGLDIDPEAVLIARRSLWLELSAGRSSRQARRGVARRLAETIGCGDVLAGSGPARAAPRFDLILGNPPYRRERGAKPLLDQVAATELGRKYRAPRMDYWYYFVHRGLELLKPGGRLSLVVGSYWTSAPGAEKLVRQLRESAHVEEIVCFDGASAFAGVSGRQMILTLTQGASQRPTIVRRVQVPPPSDMAGQAGDDTEWPAGGRAALVYEKSPAELFRAGRIDLEPPSGELLAKLARHPPLGQLGRVAQGIVENPASITAKANRQYGDRWKAGEGVFTLDESQRAALNLPPREQELLRPYYDLCDLGRYWIAPEPSLSLIYTTAATCARIDAVPVIGAHLARFRPIMEARRETRRGCRAWWQLHWPREPGLWPAAKIICVQMAPRPALVPVAGPAYVSFSTNVFVPGPGAREDLLYVAAVLNSRLLWKWYLHHAKRRGVGLEINGHVLAASPLRRIDFADPAERSCHRQLVRMAGQMLHLNRQLRSVADQRVLKRLRRRLQQIDRQIDQAVYRLYGLDTDEIAVVEAATGGVEGG
jgi:adenine-specific DNA-methyltransferase